MGVLFDCLLDNGLLLHPDLAEFPENGLLSLSNILICEAEKMLAGVLVLAVSGSLIGLIETLDIVLLFLEISMTEKL